MRPLLPNEVVLWYGGKKIELSCLARARDVEWLQIPVTVPIPHTLLSLLRIFCMKDNQENKIDFRKLPNQITFCIFVA